MSFTFDSYQSLLLPAVAIFAYYGWQRGLWREFAYTFGMLVIVLLTVVAPVEFIGFIERVIINIPRVFALLFGLNLPTIEPGTLFGTPDSSRFLLTRVVLFALLTILLYSNSRSYSWAVEGGKPRQVKGFIGRATGAVLAGLTGLLWFLAINDFLNALRAQRPGQTIPPEGMTITLPAVDNTAVLLTFVPTLLVVLLVVLAILAALRLPNLWR